MNQDTALEQLLLQRSSGQPPSGVTADRQPAFPGSPPTRPKGPAWDRWNTAEQMKDGYANNWQPNPMLIRLMKEAQ